jgi:hypothetical protein
MTAITVVRMPIHLAAIMDEVMGLSRQVEKRGGLQVPGIRDDRGVPRLVQENGERMTHARDEDDRYPFDELICYDNGMEKW